MYPFGMINSFLKDFGLSHKEISLFNILLNVGTQSASQIARLSELPRNTTRSILDKLVKEGLLIKTSKANTQYYSTEKRKHIIRMLKTKRVRMNSKIDSQIELLERYGDELDFRHHSKTRPKITFYEGLSGLEKVYEDTLTSKSGLRSWASYDHLLDVMPDYFGDYFKRRTELKIPMKSIHPDTKKARQAQARDSEELRESALIPSDRFDWQPEIQVYENKLNITSWKEKLAIIIESEEIANAMKAIFDLSYEAAKNYDVYTDDI